MASSDGARIASAPASCAAACAEQQPDDPLGVDGEDRADDRHHEHIQSRKRRESRVESRGRRERREDEREFAAILQDEPDAEPVAAGSRLNQAISQPPPAFTTGSSARRRRPDTGPLRSVDG